MAAPPAKRTWLEVASRADVVLRLYDLVLSNPDLVRLVLQHDASATDGWRVEVIFPAAVCKAWHRVTRAVRKALESWHKVELTIPDFKKLVAPAKLDPHSEPYGDGQEAGRVWLPPFQTAGAFMWQLAIVKPRRQTALRFVLAWPSEVAGSKAGVGFARRTDFRLRIHDKDGKVALHLGSRWMFDRFFGLSMEVEPTAHTSEVSSTETHRDDPESAESDEENDEALRPVYDALDRMLVDGAMRLTIHLRVTRGQRCCTSDYVSKDDGVPKHVLRIQHPMVRDEAPAPRHTFYFCDRCDEGRPTLAEPEAWPAIWRCAAGCNFDLCDACHDELFGKTCVVVAQ